MNFFHKLILITAVLCNFAAAADSTTPLSASPQPAFQPQDSQVGGYVPQGTYPYTDPYGGYDGYFVPPADPHGGYMSSLVPSARSALQTVLKVIAKVGLFLVGGLALLVVGGLFTTAVCSITPFCTITFNGFGKLTKESVRSYMTPENMAHAAAFVEDAVHKYQRMQRNVPTRV